MANGKAMGPNEVSVDLLKLGIPESQAIFEKFHDIIVKVWIDEEVGGRGEKSDPGEERLGRLCQIARLSLLWLMLEKRGC